MAGTLGHYIADLSQPMHVSENYDGEATGQKGLHAFFEDRCVDELYPRISDEVLNEARKRWPVFKKENANRSVNELVQNLAKGSREKLKGLLDLDKKTGRKDIKKAASAHKNLIVSRLAEGSLYLAELYRRQLGWKFDNNRFYFFSGEPNFVAPGEVVNLRETTDKAL